MQRSSLNVFFAKNSIKLFYESFFIWKSAETHIDPKQIIFLDVHCALHVYIQTTEEIPVS